MTAPPIRRCLPASLTLALALVALAVPSTQAQNLERRSEAELDVVTLLDGDQLKGQVVYQDAEQVVLRKRTRETVLPRAEVEQVDSRVAHLDRLLDVIEGRGRLLRQSPESLLEQAAFAEHSRLPGEARLLRLAVLLGHPDHAEAHELLGDKHKRTGWSTRRGRDWVPMDELADLPGDWDERWTLQTAHYELRTNIALPDALTVAFDLERLYRAVFELVGPVVQLREPREVFVVQLHADDASFPEPGSGRAEEFREDDRIAYANAARPRWRTYLFHAAVRQLLYSTSEFAINARGRVPLWLSTGLAEAFARSTSGPAGATRFEPTEPDAYSHRIHAAAPEPFRLKRVIVFTDAELSTRDEFQALRYAQCATLAQYLLAGDSAIHRPGLDDFLVSCWRGQASPSHLEDALVLDLEELDEPWLRHVHRIGGP